MNYEFEHAIECPVKKDFAWKFWTNVENWAVVDKGVESVKLDGDFAAGAKGTTKPVGHPPTEWEIIAVEDGKSATIGIGVPGAILKFVWTFEERTSGTLITQRVLLEGERAADYAEGLEGLKIGIPEGMQSMCKGMKRAAQNENKIDFV